MVPKNLCAGVTIVQPEGFEIRKSQVTNFLHVLFDLSIYIGITEDRYMFIQIRNFRAFRDREGNIRFFFPKGAYVPRAIRKSKGVRAKSPVFLNDEVLLGLRKEIEKLFGHILVPQDYKKEKAVPRFRAESPEDAVKAFLEKENSNTPKVLED